MIFEFGKNGAKLGTIGEIGKALGTIGLSKVKSASSTIGDKINETAIGGKASEIISNFIPESHDEKYFLDADFDFFKDFDGGKSAREAIELVWGDLEVYSEHIADTTKEYLSSIWLEIEDGSAKVQDIIRENFDGNVEIIDQSLVNAQNMVKEGFDKVKGIAAQFASKAGSVILNSLVSMGITWLISEGIGLAIKGIDELLHHVDHVIEAGKEASQNIQDEMDKIKQKADDISSLGEEIGIEVEGKTSVETLDEIAKKYAELKSGVNDLTNANKSLTTEKYNEYLSICNKIKDIYPDLVIGYDSQGNAIINLSTNAKECAQSLKEMYDNALLSSNVEITFNIEKSLDSVTAEIERAEDQIDALGIKNIETQLQKFQDRVSSGFDMSMGIDKISFDGTISKKDVKAFDTVIENMVKEGLISKGAVDIKDIATNFWGGYKDSFIEATGFSDLDPTIQQEAWRRYLEEINDDAIDNLAYFREQYDEALNESEQYQKVRIDAYNRATSDINNYLKTSYTFNSNDSDLQSAILKNYKFDEEEARKWSEEYKKDFYDYIYSEIISPLSNINEDDVPKIKAILNVDYSILDDKPVADVKRSIESQFKDIFGGEAGKMMDMFGINQMFQGFFDKRKEVFSQLAENIDGGLTHDQIMEILGFSPKEINDAINVLQNETITTWDQFVKSLTSYRPSIPKEGKLSDIFNSEDYSSKAEAIEKSITALTTAIASAYENGGQAIGEAANTLQEAMPDTDFGDFTIGEMNDQAVNQLEKWIDLLYEQADAAQLTESAMNDLNSYVRNLVMSYKDLDISSEDIISALNNNVFKYNKKGEGYVDYLGLKEGFSEEFVEELGNEEDRQILYTLALNPESATWTVEQWREEYDNLKLNWDIVLNKEEFDKRIAQMEAAVAKAQAEADEAAKKRQLDNARGIHSNDEEYIQTQINSKRTEQRSNEAQIQGLLTGKSSDSVLYKLQSGQIKKDDEDAIKLALSEQNTKIQELKNANLQLEIDVVGLLDEEDLIPYNELENKLEVLKADASSLQEVMNDDTKAPSIDNYAKSIGNASEQIAVLKKEEEFWQEKLNDTSLEKNTEEYVKYYTNLQNTKSAINELTNSQQEWMKAIQNFTIDELNRQLAEYNYQLEKLADLQALNEAKGEKKTPQDYDDENAIQAGIQETNTQKAKILQARLSLQTALSNMGIGEIDLSPINKLFGTDFGNIKLGIDKNSTEYDSLTGQIREAESAAIQAETEQVKNLHEQEQLRAQGMEETLETVIKTGDALKRQNKDTYTNNGVLIPEEEQQKVLTNLNTQSLLVSSLIKEYEVLAESNKKTDGTYNTYGEGYIKKVDYTIIRFCIYNYHNLDIKRHIVQKCAKQ